MIKTLLFTLFLTLMTLQGFSQSSGDAQPSFSEKELKEVKTSVDLYPNPVTEFLYINIESDNLHNVEFEIFNIIGNSVKIEVEKVNQNNYKIPVRTLSSGYYLLIISDEKAKYNQAFKFQKK